jgi:hypothetical protein
MLNRFSGEASGVHCHGLPPSNPWSAHIWENCLTCKLPASQPGGRNSLSALGNKRTKRATERMRGDYRFFTGGMSCGFQVTLA